MRAAVLAHFGAALHVEEVADPVLGTGEMIVDVAAAPVLPYTGEVLSGERRYDLVPPVVPGVGGVGRVREVGPDATRLGPGDWVFCDPTVRSRDDVVTPDIALQGWSARGEGGRRLARHHHDGAFAARMRVPTENALALGAIADADAGVWCALGLALVPYGGLAAVDLRPGETVLVSGATGNYGSAGVAVALAMGARAVVCPGRDEAMLGELERRFGDRVRPVVLTGDGEADRERMVAAAPAPIDVVLDLLPPAAPATAVRAAAMTVREYGRIALMGGVGMLGGDDLALPYPWLMRRSVTVRGQWMYRPADGPRLVGLARAGLLDLRGFAVTEFALDDAAAAVAHAAREGGRFALTVLRM